VRCGRREPAVGDATLSWYCGLEAVMLQSQSPEAWDDIFSLLCQVSGGMNW
jgi:hypothetical protein